MAQLVEVPGQGVIEFPDNMSDAQITEAIENNILKPREKMSIPMAAAVSVSNAPRRLTHGILQPVLESGLLGDTVAAKSKAFSQEKEAQAEQAMQDHPLVSTLAESRGNLGVGLLFPGGSAKTVLGQIGAGVAANAALGGAQYVPEGGSRLFNSALGGVIGATFPAAFGAANKVADAIKKPMSYVAKNVMGGIDDQAALATKTAANRIGVNLTPAEASGSPLVAQAQGKLGTSKEGALMLQKFGNDRAAQEKSAISGLLDDISPDSAPAAESVRNTAKNIQSDLTSKMSAREQQSLNGFLDDISPNNTDVAGAVRQTAKNIIKQREDQLIRNSNPLYEASYRQSVEPNKLKDLMKKDGTIEKAVNDVLSDPRYRVELEGYQPNSIKVLDLAKRRIDAQIDAAKGTAMVPGDQDLVRVLTDSKKRLIGALDGFSRDYKQAREIYSEGSKPLTALRNSNIGKIADLDDIQLKNVSKIIFDANETNPKVLADIRDQIYNKSPELWRTLIRNEFDRRLSKASNLEEGQNFSKALFKNSKDLQQFMIAVKPIPGMQDRVLAAMNTFSKSKPITQINNTPIGKIAAMDDIQIKNISKTIFDPSQTDTKVLRQLRDKISKENPEAWRGIVRNEMERRLDNTNSGGSSFYSKVLKSDRAFNQFIVATEKIPGATQKLIDMRTTFKNLINPISPATSSRLAKSSLDVPRSTYEAATKAISNFTGGKYDKAAISLITSNKWDKELAKIKAVKSPVERGQLYANLLAKVTTLGAANSANDIFKKEEEANE